MKINFAKVVLLTALFITPCVIVAQDLPLDSLGRLKTKHSSFLIGGGSVNCTDNFFSEIEFNGYKVGMQKESISSFSNLEKWIYRDVLEFSFLYGNASKTKLSYTSLPHYRLEPNKNFNFYLGAGPSISFANNNASSNINNFTYNSFSLDLRLSGMVTYRLPFESFPAMFKLSSEVSTFGVSFAPGYGQNSYIIANIMPDESNFVFTNWSNTISHKHQLSVDIPFKNTTYKLAYQYEGFSSKLNNNMYKQSGGSMYIGMAYEFVKFSGKKAMNKKNIKSLIYE